MLYIYQNNSILYIIYAFPVHQGIGGFQDNNGGLDYHIPVDYGSQVDMIYSDNDDDQSQEVLPRDSRSSTLSVVHIAVEMAPIAKVGW